MSNLWPWPFNSGLLNLGHDVFETHHNGVSSCRIRELQELLKEQKKKELEETAAMEHAMEQVEQNLVETTVCTVSLKNKPLPNF